MGGRSQAHLPRRSPGAHVSVHDPVSVCVCGPEYRECGHFCSYMSCQMCIDLIICLRVCVYVCLYASVCVHMGMCVPGSCMYVYICEHVHMHVCMCMSLCVCILCVCMSLRMCILCVQHKVFILCPGPPPVSRVSDCLGCSLPLFFLHSQSPWASQEDIT